MVPGASNDVIESRFHWEAPLVDRCTRAEYYLLPHRTEPVVWQFRADLFSDLSP